MALELLTIASTGYTGYSTWLMADFYRKAKTTGEGLNYALKGARGVELHRLKTNYEPPIYIGTGHNGSIGIPIGGWTYTDREFVFSQWNTTDVVKEEHWIGLRGSRDNSAVKKWINTAEELHNVCAQYQISNQAFPATLPLRAVTFHWTSPVWYDLRSGVISTNQRWVAKEAALARRLPFTFSMMGCIAFVGGFWWMNRRHY